MKFEGKIGGFTEMSQLFKQLPDRVEKKVLQRATLDGLRAARADVKAAAPVGDPSDRSPSSQEYGSLKANIRVVRKKRVKKGQKGAVITTNKAFWGFILEKGSRFIPAQPWFLPAITGAYDKVTKAMAESMRTNLTKEIEKFRNSGK